MCHSIHLISQLYNYLYTLGQKASKMDSYQYVLDAMMIPFDTWDMQSIRESNFLDKKNDLQMTFNYEKTQNIFGLLFHAFRKGKSKF